MKSTNILACLVTFFLVLALSFAGQGVGISRAASAPASPHQGHTGGGTPPATTPEKQIETEPTTQAAEDIPTIEIPVEKQQLIGIKSITVAKKSFQGVVRTVGRVDYDERGLATINTKFEGWVEKLYVNATGSFVKKGQPLAEIYSPELYATQKEFLNTLRWAKKTQGGNSESIEDMLAKDADTMVEAAKQRLLLWDISEAQIKMIAQTGKPIRTLTVASPVTGSIIQKPVTQGMRIMPGEKMFDIADLSTLWIVADLYESQMAQVTIGQKATITFNNFPGRVFAATIDFIYPTLTGETRTAKARCILPNPDGLLKPQMFANMEIKTDQGERLAVPDDSVIDTGTKKIVYIDKGEGLFEPREVVTGLKVGGLTELLQGVAPGEKIVATANFLIDSEAQLKGIAPLSKQ